MNPPRSVPAVPNLPSPSGSRPRNSVSSSFSFDPAQLVHSFNEGSNSKFALLDPNRSLLTASPLRSSPRHARKARQVAKDKHPLAQDGTTDVFLDNTNDEDEEYDREWGMVDRMRLWRHDAMLQHLYSTAAFWGDKILSWTNDKNDAFWLAQAYFMLQQYSRAERLLTRPFPDDEDDELERPITNGNSHPISAPLSTIPVPDSVRGKGRATDLFNLNSLPPFAAPHTQAHKTRLSLTGTDSRLPMGSSTAEDIVVEQQRPMSMLVDMSVACRYLAAQCQFRLGRWADAKEMLGESNPFRGTFKSGSHIANNDGGIKIEASMCYLRGILMLKLGRPESAKTCFMEALSLDVKCYEAFDQLTGGELMTVDEEWEFMQGLQYKEQTAEDSEFIRLIYMSRLRKYKHAEEHALCRRRLVEEFGLSDNPDVLFSFADALYTQARYADCYVVTQRILSLIPIHEPTMPLHIGCMYHLPHLNSKLFLLAHEMVDKEPESHLTWHAVAAWYLAAGKSAEAKVYFGKTTIMDPRFGPAWIGFGHSYSAEGEHDQAKTAYSTAVRNLIGSHLPHLFVGMEHMILSSYQLAEESLNTAQELCDSDPLLHNERGVMAYNRGNYAEAVTLFKRSIELADASQGENLAWVTTFVNLGTALRQVGDLEEARNAYRRALEIDSRNSVSIAYLGKIHFLMGDIDIAITRYHEALSIDPLNGHVIELLNIALEADSAVWPALRKGVTSVDEIAVYTKKRGRKAAPTTGRPNHGESWKDRMQDKDGDAEMRDG